jgi:hypothetical protein
MSEHLIVSVLGAQMCIIQGCGYEPGFDEDEGCVGDQTSASVVPTEKP